MTIDDFTRKHVKVLVPFEALDEMDPAHGLSILDIQVAAGLRRRGLIEPALMPGLWRLTVAGSKAIEDFYAERDAEADIKADDRQQIRSIAAELSRPHTFGERVELTSQLLAIYDRRPDQS